MTKLTTTLEKLNYFTTKWVEIQKQSQDLDTEWATFAEKDLNLKGTGTIHISQVIKAAIEKTYEPTIVKG